MTQRSLMAVLPFFSSGGWCNRKERNDTDHCFAYRVKCVKINIVQFSCTEMLKTDVNDKLDTSRFVNNGGRCRYPTHSSPFFAAT